MIIDTEVLITLNTRNAKHFRSIGYHIPTYVDTNKKSVVKRGSTLLVKVSDLSKGSGVLVTVKCDFCGKEMKRRYCAVQGKSPFNCHVCNGKIHKTGTINTRDKICECGTLIRRGAKQCQKCYIRKSKERKFHCLDCGVEINRKSVRCVVCSNTGVNNPMYNHNTTDEYRLLKRSGVKGLSSWRVRCLYRDGFTCVKCGIKGVLKDGIMQVHHIENFKSNYEKRIMDENGATLCIDCHKEFHHIYGKLNTNHNQFEEFLGGCVD